MHENSPFSLLLLVKCTSTTPSPSKSWEILNFPNRRPSGRTLKQSAVARRHHVAADAERETSSRPFPQFTHGRRPDGRHPVIFGFLDGVGPVTGDLTAKCESRVTESWKVPSGRMFESDWGMALQILVTKPIFVYELTKYKWRENVSPPLTTGRRLTLPIIKMNVTIEICVPNDP